MEVFLFITLSAFSVIVLGALFWLVDLPFDMARMDKIHALQGEAYFARREEIWQFPAIWWWIKELWLQDFLKKREEAERIKQEKAEQMSVIRQEYAKLEEASKRRILEGYDHTDPELLRLATAMVNLEDRMKEL